jgi:hypothetical protein
MKKFSRPGYKMAVCACVLMALQPLSGWAGATDAASPYNQPAQAAPQYDGAQPVNPQASTPPGYRQPNYEYPPYGLRPNPYRGRYGHPGYRRPAYGPPWSARRGYPPAYGGTEPASAAPTARPLETYVDEDEAAPATAIAPATAEDLSTLGDDEAEAVAAPAAVAAPLAAEPAAEPGLMERAKAKLGGMIKADEAPDADEGPAEAASATAPAIAPATAEDLSSLGDDEAEAVAAPLAAEPAAEPGLMEKAKAKLGGMIKTEEPAVQEAE